jgi:hypothetical protein
MVRERSQLDVGNPCPAPDAQVASCATALKLSRHSAAASRSTSRSARSFSGESSAGEDALQRQEPAEQRTGSGDACVVSGLKSESSGPAACDRAGHFISHGCAPILRQGTPLLPGSRCTKAQESQLRPEPRTQYGSQSPVSLAPPEAPTQPFTLRICCQRSPGSGECRR